MSNSHSLETLDKTTWLITPDVSGLTSLSFKDCVLIDSTTTARHTIDLLTFPNLHTISLIRTSLTPGTSNLLLSPRALPALTSLTLSSCSIVEDAHSLLRLGSCEPKELLAAVRQLALDGITEDELQAFEWNKMRKLRQLSVPLTGLDGVAVGELAELVHLRVSAHSASPGALSRSASMLSPHAAGPAALAPHLAAAKTLVDLLAVDPAHPGRGAHTRQTLRHFTLPGEWRDRPDCTEPGEMRRTLERLGKACRRERVGIRFDVRAKGHRGGWRVGDRGEEEEHGRKFWEPEANIW